MREEGIRKKEMGKVQVRRSPRGDWLIRKAMTKGEGAFAKERPSLPESETGPCGISSAFQKTEGPGHRRPRCSSRLSKA